MKWYDNHRYLVYFGKEDDAFQYEMDIENISDGFVQGVTSGLKTVAIPINSIIEMVLVDK